MKTKLLKLLLLAPLVGLVSVGCNRDAAPPAVQNSVSASGEEVADTAPPAAPPYADVQTASPGPDYVWIGGAWSWGGGHWQWEKGRWDRPSRPGASWVANHYENRSGKHVFVRGGWR